MFGELKEILAELLASDDPMGCTPDLTVVSAPAMVRLSQWHKENALDRDDVRYELTSDLDGNDSENLQSRNYLSAVEESFEALQHRVTEWDEKPGEEIEGDPE